MSAKGDIKIFKEIENINSRPKPLRNSSIVQSNGSLPTSMLHLVSFQFLCHIFSIFQSNLSPIVTRGVV